MELRYQPPLQGLDTLVIPEKAHFPASGTWARWEPLTTAWLAIYPSSHAAPDWGAGLEERLPSLVSRPLARADQLHPHPRVVQRQVTVARLGIPAGTTFIWPSSCLSTIFSVFVTIFFQFRLRHVRRPPFFIKPGCRARLPRLPYVRRPADATRPSVGSNGEQAGRHPPPSPGLMHLKPQRYAAFRRRASLWPPSGWIRAWRKRRRRSNRIFSVR